MVGWKLTASLVLDIGLLPFHHVIVAGGLEPKTEQLSSYDVSADSGWFSPCNLTINGRTERENVFGFSFIWKVVKYLKGNNTPIQKSLLEITNLINIMDTVSLNRFHRRLHTPLGAH